MRSRDVCVCVCVGGKRLGRQTQTVKSNAWTSWLDYALVHRTNDRLPKHHQQHSHMTRHTQRLQPASKKSQRHKHQLREINLAISQTNLYHAHSVQWLSSLSFRYYPVAPKLQHFSVQIDLYLIVFFRLRLNYDIVERCAGIAVFAVL